MQIFSIFIHSANSTTPTHTLEVASDVQRVLAIAQEALEEAEHGLVVEVRKDNERLFSLDRNGVRWSAGQPAPQA